MALAREAAVVLGGQLELLERRAHAAVVDDDAAADRFSVIASHQAMLASGERQGCALAPKGVAVAHGRSAGPFDEPVASGIRGLIPATVLLWERSRRADRAERTAELWVRPRGPEKPSTEACGSLGASCATIGRRSLVGRPRNASAKLPELGRCVKPKGFSAGKNAYSGAYEIKTCLRPELRRAKASTKSARTAIRRTTSTALGARTRAGARDTSARRQLEVRRVVASKVDTRVPKPRQATRAASAAADRYFEPLRVGQTGAGRRRRVRNDPATVRHAERGEDRRRRRRSPPSART